MPNTYIDYTAPVNNYTFTFPYLNVSHVKVFVDGVEKTQGTHYTVEASPTRVVFTAGNTPSTGAIVRIRRVTFKDSALVDFVNGATLIESDLDTAVRQTLYINQETTELNDTALQIGAGSQDFYAQNKKITHVATPTDGEDAANKNYVDSTTVSISGDTMTGALAMSNNKITGLGTPTGSADAATKGYVDTNDTLKLNKAGDTMSGNLAMAGNRVTGLADPASAQDAATQASVNAAIASAVQFGSTTPPDVYSFTGTGNTSEFILGPATASSIIENSAYLVSVDGVLQKPGDDFTISLAVANVQIQFSSAPPSGSSIVVQAIGYKVPIGDAQIPNGSITAVKLANDSVTTSKIQNGAITSAKLASSVDFTNKTVTGLTNATVGLGNVTNVNTTDASNITSGTISVDRLPLSGTGNITISPRNVSSFNVDNKGRILNVSNGPGGLNPTSVATLNITTAGGVGVSGWGRQAGNILQYSTYGVWQQIGGSTNTTANNVWRVDLNNGVDGVSDGFVLGNQNALSGYTNGTYVVRAPGVYRATLQGLVLGATGGYCQLALGKSSASLPFYSYQNFLGYQYHHVTGIFSAVTNETIIPFMYINANSWFIHTGYTTFIIERLS